MVHMKDAGVMTQVHMKVHISKNVTKILFSGQNVNTLAARFSIMLQACAILTLVV